MLRSMLLLVVTIFTLSAAELDKVADYHRSLLGDAAPLFDQFRVEFLAMDTRVRREIQDQVFLPSDVRRIL